jgi:hypothetical protein
MDEQRILSATKQRTRRNMIKMGAILGSAAMTAVLTKADPTRASGVCAAAFGCKCLLRGTNIQTAAGKRRIEDLAVGDLLPTVFGGVRPIQWIGHYSVKNSDPSRPWAKDALPVRLARSALAPDVPHADLYVSGEHALLVDGLLIPARTLINGTTISRHEAFDADELEFFHIRLESHDAYLCGRGRSRDDSERGRERGQFRRVFPEVWRSGNR